MKPIKLSRDRNLIMIKKFLFSALLISLLLSCSTSDNNSNNNPFLVDTNFNLNINLSLPEYNSLNFPGNSYVTYNYGLNGVVVYNINNTQYLAFELTDPNHSVSNCSRLTVQGLLATCNCGDGNEYNILTGEITQGEGQYALKSYRVRKNGNTLEIYN